MTLTVLKNEMHSLLIDVFGKAEVESFFYILIDYRLGVKKMDFLLTPNIEVVAGDEEFFNSAIQKLKNEEPIQYIIGETEFYGLLFKVTESTLIPRPETEELVDWIIKEQQLSVKEQLSILDIGTGSGCIPVSLAKKLSNATVASVDVSKEAIKVAQKNAVINKADVTFLNDSILEPTILNSDKYKFDVIVSNPPYVRNLEKQEIKKNVLCHEPHLALFVEDDDALIFYRSITEYALNHLKKDGVLYFEINQYLGKETVALIEQLGFSSVELRKDMSGNDRMIKASGF